MPPRPLLLPLALIAVLALASRVVAAATFGIGFDEGLHMFVAKALTLHQMFRELLGDTHPPLHYLLLRVLPGAEVSVLWPRLASIVPSVIGVVLVGCLASRLEIARPVWWVGMLLLAVSHTDVTLGASIRSYALADALVLLAVLAAIELLRRPPRATAGPWVAVLLVSTAACWSLYASALVLVAFALATALAVPRRVPAMLRGLLRPLPLVALSVAVACAVLLLVFCSRTIASGPLGHVQPFLRPVGQDFFTYGARGLLHSLSQVSPIELVLQYGVPGWAALLAFGTLAVWLAAGELRAAAANPARPVLALMMPLGYLMLVVLGTERIYPLGGDVRHQYPLFAFVVLWGMLAGDRVYRRVSGRAARGALIALALGAGAWTSWASYRGRPIEDFGLPAWRWQADGDALRQELEPGDVLYLGQRETMALHGSAWGQRWRLQRDLPEQRALFEVEGAAPPFVALRMTAIWNLPCDLDTVTLVEIAADMRAAGVDAVWQVDLEWNPIDGETFGPGPSPQSLGQAGLQLERQIDLPRGRARRLRLLR